MISIFSNKYSERLDYVLNIIFGIILNVPHTVLVNRQDFTNALGPKINYSEHDLDTDFQIHPSKLLFERGVDKIEPKVEWRLNYPFYFKNSDNFLGFDVFAASFYLLSRYEEYGNVDLDEHGRYEPENSIAHKNSFLELPVVDIWGLSIKSKILEKYPRFVFRENQFKHLPTVDVDVQFAYKGRNFIRVAGAVMHSNKKENLGRFKVLIGKQNDPYDTYLYFSDLHKKYKLETIYFFLVGKYGEYDKNISIRKNKYQTIIQNIAIESEIGVHPSYGSHVSRQQLESEIFDLQRVVERRIEKSRQHFIKLKLPETYRSLIELGITEDYSMGYVQYPGFRAGIARPFPFYDLEREEETNLMLFPFQLMDGTLNQYLGLSPSEALEKAREISEKIKSVKGTLITIWHNSSLANMHHWEGWEGVYAEILRVIHTK